MKPPEISFVAPENVEEKPSIDARVFTYKGQEAQGAKFSFADLMLLFLQDVMQGSSTTVRGGRKTQSALLAILTVMYGLSFLLGLVAFGVSIYMGAHADSATKVATSAIFGGLSAGIFLAFFILRPTAGIERASISNLWMTITGNSYWTRLAYGLQAEAGGVSGREHDRRLEDATSATVKDLESLLKYAMLSERQYLKVAREEAARSSAAAAPTISLTAPSSPASLALDQNTALDDITVAVTPADSGITWSIDGDDDGELVEVTPGTFRYTRGSAATDKVTLTFGVAGGGATALLEVDAEATEADDAEAPTLEVTAPASPVTLAPDPGRVLDGIMVETTPEGVGMTWAIDGDDDGVLVQVQPGEFQYTRGTAASDKVRLAFAVSTDDSVTGELIIEARLASQ